MKNKLIFFVLAVLAPGFALAVPTILFFNVTTNNVLVYCPPSDAAGCERIVAAVGGAEKAYDGSDGTVDLRSADLSAFTALVIPSLADGDAAQPYALLRDPAVSAHVRQSVLGRRVFWSGAPDLGSENRGSKDGLLGRLASYAGGNHESVNAPGLVVLLDRSSSNRYGWVEGVTGINLVADPAIKTYSSVRTVTTTGSTIVDGVAYANMASFGFFLPQGAAGVRLDAVGQTLTTVGGQIVLMTHPGANTDAAVVSTEKDDYAPGETVTITGSGFLAGEPIELALVEDPEIHESTSFTVTADVDGNFIFTDFAPDDHDIDVRFILSATGQTSERRAETTFTDAISVGSNGTNSTGSGGGNQLALTPPTNVTGDVLLAQIVVTKFFNNNYVCAPSGWTSVVRTNNKAGAADESDLMQETFVHIAASPLTGTQNFTFRTGANCTGSPVTSRHASGGITVFTGVDNASPVNVSLGATGTSSTTATPPIVTTTVANTRVVRLAGIFKNLTPTASTPTPIPTRIYSVPSASGNERTAVAWSAAQGAAGATAAFVTGHASAAWVAQTIALREAPTLVQAVATATDGGGTFNGSAFTGNGSCSNGLTPAITYSGGSPPVNAGTTTFTVTCGDGGVAYINGVDDGSIVITPALVTATAGSGSAAYDGSTKSPSACSVTGAYTGDLACTNSPATVGPSTGTTPIAPSVTGTGIGTNFTVTPSNGSYTINAAQAVATAVDGGGTFNGSAFTGSGTCSNGLTAAIVYSGGSPPVNAGTTTFSVTCGDGGNNFIDGVDNGDIVITPALVNATAGSGSATYDGSSKSPSPCSVTGAYTGDLACTNSPALVGPNVGTTPITPSVTGTGIGTNFTVTPSNGSYTINGAQAIATAIDGGGAFSGSAFTGSGTCSNLLTPDIVYSGGSAPVNAGTTSFSVTCGDGGNNFINGVDNGDIVITPALVNATAGGGSATYDGSAKSPSPCSVTGAYTGDLACTNSPASVGPNVGTTPITPSVTGTGIGTNFTVTPSNGSYTINAAQAVASAINGGGTFSGSAFTGSGTCSDGLSPVIVYSGGSAPVNAGTSTFSVTCGDGDNNFINGVDNGDIVITPALVNATAGGGSATYDGSAKSPSACLVTGAYTGDVACTNSPTSVGPNVGTTTITPSVTGTGIGTNFTVTPSNGSYTINAAQAVATAVDGGGTFNGSAFTGSGTCSDGLTPVIVYSGGSAPVNAGTTTFSVTCGDGGNNFIDGVDEGTIVIAKANAAVTVNGFTGTYDGDPHGASGGAAGVSSEDLTGLLDLGASFTNAPGGTANWSFAGNANYNAQNGSAAIVIAKKGVTASISAADKIYNGSNAAAVSTCTVNGTVGVDDVTCGGGSATFDNANAGPGKAVTATGLSLGGASAGNYDLSPTTSATTAAITPKDVTTSITASDKVFDGNTTATIASCTVNGKVGSDDVTCGGAAAFASANAGSNINVSSTNIALTGSAGGNYNLTSANASTTANITPAPVTVSISANAAARQYTDNLTVTVSVAAVNAPLSSLITGSLTGAAGTQTFVSGSALSATNTANVTLMPGSYTLTGTFESTNPNFQSGTPATQPLTVTPEDATPKYTGDTWIQATSTGAATITLSAIVYDASDGMTGSVANSRVTFIDVQNGNSPLGICKDVRVNIIDASNPSQGKATCAWTVTLGKSETSRTVTVGFAIAGSHKNKDAVATTTAVVTITRNAPFTMTGGAAVVGGAPTSMWTGAVGGAEFGLSMSYTSKLTNPQGSVWVKFNVGGVNYLAKSNSLLNFSVFAGATPTSTFSAKANIVNMETGAAVDGNSIIQLSVVDGKGANGAGDQIAITINGKTGGVIYSNRWDRGTAKTLLEALAVGTGNIAINVK